MNEAELALVKEAMQLIGNALATLEAQGNSHIKHFASILGLAVQFGNFIVSSK